MPTLLQLDSSADLTASRSRALTAAFAEAWRAAGPDHTVVVRDLHTQPLPHLADSEQHYAADLRRPGSAVPPQADALQRQVLDELLAADALVVGVPTYNYSMPSTLKAWVDCIHVPGVTVSFDGTLHPMAGRPAVLISTAGGTYDAGTPTEDWNHAIPPLQIILGDALGMDVSVIRCTRTLADRVPGLAPEVDRAAAEFETARQEAVAIAQRLAGVVTG
ncbi:FMN-dependent NADH-azoreductase [Friedmanniella endophytica]|uniref:FMN dependent NADH:quinone oxidoreductase n=1 Tax=Microlunatus kandeliicorticis TaxID=1759536 RepID=A0A7W3IQ17_9ACTN|nr:NAD(P)H-dependent oxidoreductase [Microlunatus kandeliicorticis]MBA8793133.1 FMN-dependent NADH-azoreductase [Microlunatus kandeliicorticis]